jgi:hypothetical protein
MVSTSWKNELKFPESDCKYCGCNSWKVGFYTDAGGNPKYPFVCVACGKRTQRFAKRKAVETSGIEVHRMHPMTLPYVCEVCDSEGAERHHWAPEHLFESDSEKWPTSYLCPPCHKKWHDIVTPNMVRHNKKINSDHK